MPIPAEGTEFLPPHLLEHLGGLDLVAQVVVRGFQAGLHRASRRGAGEDFARHREYQQGDDVRHLDWRLFARTDRLYVRQYEERSELSCYMVVDATASMGFGDPGGVTKLRYACFVAAALAHLMLRAGDAVGLCAVDREPRLLVSPRQRTGQLHALLLALQGLAPGGTAGLGGGVDRAAEALPRRGRVAVVSDLLTRDDGAALLAAVRRLRARGDEVLLFRLLTATELGDRPLGEGDFYDPELPDPAVPAAGADGEYRRRLDAHFAGLEERVTAAGAEYAPLRTDEPVEVGLLRWAAAREG